MSDDPRGRRLDFVFRLVLLALAMLWIVYPQPSAMPSGTAIVMETRR